MRVAHLKLIGEYVVGEEFIFNLNIQVSRLAGDSEG
jgi:hypothetical protein